MTAQIKKLISLNLALLMLIMTGIPAYAQEPTQQLVLEAQKQPREEVSASLDLFAGSGYLISVGGTTFTSDQDKQGTGWKYTASNTRLDLTDYKGTGIRASGDLTIYSNGDVTVTGSDGKNYGSDGICVDGNLTIRVRSGEMSVTGGAGNVRGGDGVYADGTFSCSAYSTAASFTGGQTYNAEEDGEPTWGGDAIAANRVTLNGDDITVTGGQGSSGSGAYGGCGIYANNITIYADCTIEGGDADCGSPGIWCRRTCSFSTVNALVMTGEGVYGLPAVYLEDNATVSTNKHTSVIKNQFYWMILINKYELLLLGKGGTIDGTATFTSLEAYYPESHDLANYLFERDGYTQVAWRTTSGNLLALNTRYQPKENTRLFAEWLAVDKGDVVLNALKGTFDGSAKWKKYQTSSVTLPNAIQYADDTLLGWCSEVSPEIDYGTYTNSGAWYAPGTTVEADPEAVINLYAREESYGQYAVYHANGGEVKAGGNMIVQGALVSHTNLQVITPDTSYVKAPAGYKLVGWATSKDATRVKYAPGVEVELEIGNVQQLYALWEEVDVDQGVEIQVSSGSKKVQVTIPAEWCGACGIKQGIAALYDPSTGKMIAASTDEYETGEDIYIEVSYTGKTRPQCAVILLDEEHSPMGKGNILNLSSY